MSPIAHEACYPRNYSVENEVRHTYLNVSITMTARLTFQGVGLQDTYMRYHSTTYHCQTEHPSRQPGGVLPHRWFPVRVVLQCPLYRFRCLCCALICPTQRHAPSHGSDQGCQIAVTRKCSPTVQASIIKQQLATRHHSFSFLHLVCHFQNAEDSSHPSMEIPPL